MEDKTEIFACERQHTMDRQIHPNSIGFVLTQENCKHLFNRYLVCLKCDYKIEKD